MEFTSKAVGKITGVTLRQIGHWDKTGLIKPSIRHATGRGSTRLYSFIDLIQFKVVKQLKDLGVTIQKLRKSLAFLRKHAPEIEKPLVSLKFLTDGQSIFVLTNDPKAIMDTLKQGQLVFSLAIGELAEEVHHSITKLSQKKKLPITVDDFEYDVILEADTEDGGFIVECPTLPGCASQGDTEDEAVHNIKAAIADWIGVKSKLKAGSGHAPGREGRERRVS